MSIIDRRQRRLTTVVLASIGLLVASVSPAAAADWAPIRRLAEGGRVTTGAALARTTAGPGVALHAVWRESGSGGRVRYARTRSSGQSWGNRVTLSATSALVGTPVVAAAGDDIYVAWTRSFGGNDSAVVFRRNADGGDAADWRASERLTSASRRASQPSIAAGAGGAVYIAYVRPGAAEVRLLVSRDRGNNWIRKTIMTGVADPASARPMVAAAGDNVAVFWLENGDILKSRESTDQGRHWTPVPDEEYALGEGLSSVAALGDRIAVAGTGDVGEGFIRVWEDSFWGFANSIPDMPLGADADPDQVDVAVALRGPGEVAVAYSARSTLTVEQAIVWVTSSNGGATWADPERVSPAFVPSDPRVVSDPSVAYAPSGRVSILWDRGPGDTADALVTRTGD